MKIRHLQTRFILAGVLLVMTTIVSGIWSAWTFARLTASIWQLNGSATVRYDVPAQRVAQFSAGLAYNPRPGATASVQYDNLIARSGGDVVQRGGSDTEQTDV